MTGVQQTKAKTIDKIKREYSYSCLNCHYLVKICDVGSLTWADRMVYLCCKHYECTDEKDQQEYLAEEIRDNRMYCQKGIWKYQEFAKIQCEQPNTHKILFENRNLDECFFIKYTESRTLEATDLLQQREAKRRTDSKQWFLTIFALIITALVGTAGITLNLFNTYLISKSSRLLFLIFFILIGYSIFLILKKKYWNSRV